MLIDIPTELLENMKNFIRAFLYLKKKYKKGYE